MTSPLRWPAVIAASLAVHAAAGAALSVWLQPDDMPVQPMPQSELEVVAHSLDRSTARPLPPDAADAAEADTAGSTLASGAVTAVRARPVAPPSTAATADATPSDRLQGASPAAEPLPTVRADPAPLGATAAEAQEAIAIAAPASAPASELLPGSEAATASVPGAEAVLPSGLPREPAVSASPSAQPAAAAAPKAARLSADPAAPAARLSSAATPFEAIAADPVQVEPAVLRPTQPDGAAAAAPRPVRVATIAPPTPSAVPAAPDAPTVATVAPRADRVKAALAFPGGGGSVDPVSLAAFQSFMEPGDPAAGGDPVRDGVAGLLAQVPCSRLQVGFDPDTTTLTVNGHIPANDLRGTVLAALQTQMGADIAVSDNMLVLPRPQCNALAGIAAVGLPQSTDQFTNPLVIGEDAHARVFGFARGDLLSLDMTAPDYDAVIYLDYFDANGDVLHLEPNEYSPLRRVQAKSVHRVGAASVEEEGLKLVVEPPFGQEIAVAFAASHPLYDGLRPIREPAGPYLEWLRGKVAEARARHPDFKGEWVYFFVETSER